eukprot:GFYU01001058.1.p1 GENE.GFYU01001058.1~~GFYU01001058.1.p1  ORF type:complete len:324 (+),score=68.51 GFYU01001058.1:200-1171(+)
MGQKFGKATKCNDGVSGRRSKYDMRDSIDHDRALVSDDDLSDDDDFVWSEPHKGEGSDYLDKIAQVFAREVGQLPVVKDFPRLARHIVVSSKQDDQSPIISKRLSMQAIRKSSDIGRSRVLDMRDVVKDIVTALSRNDEDEIDYVMDAYDEHLPTDTKGGREGVNEQSGAVDSRLERFLNDIGGEDHYFPRLLKTITQAALAPGAIFLRLNLPPTLMYKDAGVYGWKVDLNVSPRHVTVSHVKQELSFSPMPDAPQWGFTWEIRMQFDRQVERLLRCKVRVVAVDTSKVSKSERKKIKADFGDLWPAPPPQAKRGVSDILRGK